MRPGLIKTIGYLVSCVSVALLGVAAFPGAEKAGLAPALFGGMAASIVGMGLRWFSYELQERLYKAPPSGGSERKFLSTGPSQGLDRA